MNVTMEKNGNVGGIITVSLEEKDYQDKVAKDLKTIGQKHHIDGFRPGKVPAGLLKKMFGKQVLADVINRETVDALFKYIEDEKLSILGEPLAEDNQEVDFDKKDFTFKFEVGLAPAFELNVDKSITVPYYKINVTDEMAQRQDEAFTRRFGSQVPGDEVNETALIKGSVAELNEDGSVTIGAAWGDHGIKHNRFDGISWQDFRRREIRRQESRRQGGVQSGGSRQRQRC